MNAIVQTLNTAGRAFLGSAVPMLIQSSLLILILLAVDAVLRKRVRAVFRYWIWMLVLVKLVLPPSLWSPVSVGTWLGDTLEVPAAALLERGENVSRASSPRFEGGTPSTQQGQDALATPLSPGVTGILSRPQPVFVESPELESTVAPAANQAAPVNRAPAPSLNWQGFVLLIWAGVVAALLLLLIQRTFFVRGLVAQAEEASRAMLHELDRCRQHLGVRGPISVRLSPNAASPAVCGLRRPVILIPQNFASRLHGAELQAVLFHELAHVKRGDLWINLIQTILQILHFYHPLLWLANALIRRIREQAVDEMVLVAMGEAAPRYPDTLIHIAKLALARRPALSLRLIGVVESRSALTSRIKHILNRPFPKTAKLGILSFVVVLAIAAVLLPMAKARPVGGGPLAEPAKADGPAFTDSGEKGPAVFNVFGTVTDTAGRPLPDVEVVVDCGFENPKRADRAMTDPNGRYTLRFKPALYVADVDPYGVGIQPAGISARKAGFYETSLGHKGNLALAGKTPGPEEQHFVAGRAAVILPTAPYELNLVMAPAATIVGELVDAQGRPLAGQMLSLFSEQTYPPRYGFATARTDEKGQFIVRDVPCVSLHFLCPQLGVALSRNLDITTVSTWRLKLQFDDSRPQASKLAIADLQAPTGGGGPAGPKKTGDPLELRIAPRRGELGPDAVEEFTKALAEGRSLADSRCLWVPIRPGMNLAPDLVSQTYQGQIWLLVYNETSLIMVPSQGWRLVHVGRSADENARPMLVLRFDETGAAQMVRLTRSHAGQQLAVITGGVVVSAPTIPQRQEGVHCATITGEFTEQALADMTATLRRGIAEPSANNSGDFRPVKLRNGVTVELLGVCEHPSVGKQWWRPDGSRLPERPYDDEDGRAFPNPGEKGYKLAIRFNGLAGKDVGAYAMPSDCQSTNGGSLDQTSAVSSKLVS